MTRYLPQHAYASRHIVLSMSHSMTPPAAQYAATCYKGPASLCNRPCDWTKLCSTAAFLRRNLKAITASSPCSCTSAS